MAPAQCWYIGGMPVRVVALALIVVGCAGSTTAGQDTVRGAKQDAAPVEESLPAASLLADRRGHDGAALVEELEVVVRVAHAPP